MPQGITDRHTPLVGMATTLYRCRRYTGQCVNTWVTSPVGRFHFNSDVTNGYCRYYISHNATGVSLTAVGARETRAVKQLSQRLARTPSMHCFPASPTASCVHSGNKQDLITERHN